MARSKGGCGCAIAVLVAFLGALAFVGYKFVLPWWNKQPPTPSGKELRVHVLDVGQGDSILIISPEGKTVLVDAGDEKNGKRVVEALRLNGVQQLDYFIATHSHPDHIGGAAEVFGNFKVGAVLHNDFPPPEAIAKEESPAGKNANKNAGKKPAVQPARSGGRQGKALELPTVKAYNGFKGAVEQTKTEFKKAEPEQTIDLGGGAILTVLAPIPPFFTREQIAASRNGNESNANSIVVRLDYGEFSMLLAGDAEAPDGRRLFGKEANIGADRFKGRASRSLTRVPRSFSGAFSQNPRSSLWRSSSHTPSASGRAQSPESGGRHCSFIARTCKARLLSGRRATKDGKALRDKPRRKPKASCARAR